MAESPGSRIGRYRVLEPIGSGGFATVYRAMDDRLSTEVAIKVLAENHSLVPESRERFIAEAQHLRRVHNASVATLYDLGETDSGQPYMVLALADRGDLSTRIRDVWEEGHALSAGDLIVIVEMLTDSLASVHASGLVHRDVTPKNILVQHGSPNNWADDVWLVDQDERLVLCDLGYAKDLRMASGITSGGGTAGFAAPEQRDSVSIVDKRADIYGSTAVLAWAASKGGHASYLSDFVAIGKAADPDDRFEDMFEWRDEALQVLRSHRLGSDGRRLRAEEEPSGVSMTMVVGVLLLLVVLAALAFALVR